MSIFSTIVVDVEKFLKGTETEAEKFAAAFVKYLKKSPSALSTAENFISQVGVYTEAALAIVDPVDAVIASDALATVETAIGALGASLQSAQSGSSFLANLQNFANSVPTLLTGLAIKNPTLQAAITKIVNVVVAETKVLLPAVEAWVAQVKAATPTA